LDFSELSQTDSFRRWFPSEQAYDFHRVIEKRKHVLSHRIVYADFYEVRMEDMPEKLDNLLKINKTEIDQYPVHRLMQYYLEKKD
jgi:A/G-specific adenine glycosylase